jgi:hypothetical protein
MKHSRHTSVFKTTTPNMKVIKHELVLCDRTFNTIALSSGSFLWMFPCLTALLVAVRRRQMSLCSGDQFLRGKDSPVNVTMNSQSSSGALFLYRTVHPLLWNRNDGFFRKPRGCVVITLGSIERGLVREGAWMYRWACFFISTFRCEGWIVQKEIGFQRGLSCPVFLFIF